MSENNNKSDVKAEMPGTPPDICEESSKAVGQLIPNKSKAAYDQSYNRFLIWQNENHTTSCSQRVLLAYFSALSKKWKSTTLWSEYSKLAKMLKIKQNINASEYRELKEFLKKTSVGYRPKKSKTLTSQEIKKFLNEAPDLTYLATKVAMIFGVVGACRKDELIKVQTTHLKTYYELNDTEKKQPTLLVHISDTKTHGEREFVIKGKYYDYHRRYSDLRPETTPHTRYFLNYHKGKCTIQPMGEKKFASLPREIAKFLKLPNPESYTGHGFGRTSATVLAESGPDITNLKRHGGWKSSSVVESYVENSLKIKEKISNRITSFIQLNLPLTSNRGTASTFDPVIGGNPGPKESSQNPNSSTREPADVRDQLFTRNDLIAVANETFGNDKWSHAVTNQTLDFVEYVTGKYYVGCAAFVKVQLSDGSYHEDMGYSNSVDTNKGLAIFSARTGSITNALKNTLLCFGGDMAAKIKTFVKAKTNESNSVISVIAEPQRIVVSNPKLAPPQAQSTPQKIRPSPIIIVPVTSGSENGAIPPANNNERKLLSPSCLIVKPMENNPMQVDKPVSTEEEKRLERKRRQAQKQEEYRKLLKEKEAAEKPNARF